MVREPVKHNRVRIIDIDGTIIKKRSDPLWYTSVVEALPGAIETINKWFEEGDYIVFWTARLEEMREQTRSMLDSLGLRYHELLMDKPYSHDIHIYDDNLITSHRVERNVGIGRMEANFSSLKTGSESST